MRLDVSDTGQDPWGLRAALICVGISLVTFLLFFLLIL